MQFRHRPLQRRTLTKSKTHNWVANTYSDPETKLICLSQDEVANKYTLEVMNKA